MPTEVENICCREINQVSLLCKGIIVQQLLHTKSLFWPVTARMAEVPSEPTCMIDHPGFEPVCLNVYSLQNAINVYKAQFGPLHLRGIVHRYRYLAYRCFVSWCWGMLGRRVRVVLPACVVLRIRQEFPDAEGQYVGFRPAL